MSHPLLADRVLAIAHRGGAKLRPENTVAAFDHAASLGVDAIELDVRLSRDGEVVVIHDDTLDRTTDATGAVADRTAAELARVDAAFHFGPDVGHPFRGHGMGIVRLADVLARFPAMPFVIELKGQSTALAARAVGVIHAAGATPRVVVAGFDPATMAAARAAGPEIVTSASTSEVLVALYRSFVGLSAGRPACRLFQVPEVRARHRIVSPRFVRAAARAGRPVHVWIVNDEADMRRLMAWGVRGLISDRPDLAVAMVRQQSPTP